MAIIGGQAFMGLATTSIMGLFQLQFQALESQPFSSQSHLLAISQLAILMFLFISAAFILLNSLSTLEETAFWFMIMALSCVMAMCMLNSLKWAIWVALGLLAILRCRGSLKLEIIWEGC
ncbi:hypothetical protein AMTR_s00008p00087280 [Amborella trichopoda]|uniref:Uncharacterized protein n=1 Tax=Amborella trichopoda TaxID=13333 RepID=W1NHL7_AMBTC|nr:hypothetical protein AMTR_s00008p00087280 [Amborella trichopoda]